MARLSKPELLRAVERGFQTGGWSVLFLSGPNEHPARYRISKNEEVGFTLKVYIWNVTHGGGAARSASEYRIQITGITPNQFVPEINGKTLILGYWQQEEVFVGFDYQYHTGPLGGSPSMQISQQALISANQHRFATHRKDSGELAIAFLPDFIGAYALNMEALHQIGVVPSEVEALSAMAEDPTSATDAEISSNFSEPRRFAITQTRRALRSLSFSSRVLTAYGHKCAMCGVQLRLVEGAHILPVSADASTDETSNGVALCAIHHKAYDDGLVTFDREYRVHLNEMKVEEYRQASRDGRLSEFRAALRAVIHLPPSARDRPDINYVVAANSLRRWHL